MTYDLMLLADPGPERAHVARVLQEAPDVRPDPSLDNRYYLRTDHGEATVNIGTKDPVESVHVEFPLGHTPLMEAVTRRSLELAEQLRMRVEDVQWGYEVDPDSLPRLRQYWQELANRRPVEAAAAKKPWWRVW